jgi:cytochrome c oxidase subunit 2
MERAQFQAWLAGSAGTTSLASAGEKLFNDLACVTCHRADSGARGPALDGLFGKPVKLANGNLVDADESYLRESIVQPSAKIVQGYQPIMPTFQGLVTEEQIVQLVAYIQTLRGGEAAPAAAGKP